MGLRFGQIINPNVYQKVLGPEHYMKKYQGFGCSKSELIEMINEGIKIIMIIYVKKKQDEHITYLTSPKQYLEEGIEDEILEGDIQYFLKEKQMIKC